ncbi:ABC-type nitrate/sulfonate/bicarbonate transport system, substrate-binding protein [Lampropedia hyalina DSM 16112]|jgi:ABC-type nitrate/sulfonate/bicarbonate transport system substrate-binding protein|uniref:ABC-type nitrate/sulfonate/bicarbonate transport system, substrate-binding protein n=1 Tax=Lampropedia hyalina DSM 16112 TaxID=1122156 RepID=A0A1M5ECM3_9BURK|nr:ABC transporter substrate-binding protein [Lampropedia hyalina]SHF76910.1 ABC-type nitrate/sulfonate/bicarbonate transport system, substrate-binding protein [Lampropedia hyalina DSM 16112]
MTDTASTASASPETLWYTRCPVPSPLGIAAQQGWLAETFADIGIPVESIFDSKDRSIRESHFDHHLAWSFRQGGNIPPIWARAKGRATRLVGITWTDEFQAIVTLPGRGIDSVEQLAGKRLAVPHRVNDLIDFHRATALKGLVSGLSLAGLTHRDAVLVDLPIEESVILQHGTPSLFGLKRRHPYFPEVQALVRGEVDAIFVKGAEGIIVANLIGAQTVVEFGSHPDPKIRINNGTPRVLTVDAALAEQRPDLVERLLAVIDRAAQWAASHPDETLRFIAREINTSEEAVLASNGPDVHQHLGIGLDAPLVDAIGHFKDFLLEWGFLPADFDVHAWADTRGLQALRTKTPLQEAA